MRLRVVVICTALLGASLLALPGAHAAESRSPIRVPLPTVEGPVTTGTGKIVVQSTNFDLASVGYEQAEYFISGAASSYRSRRPLTNGRPGARPTARARQA